MKVGDRVRIIGGHIWSGLYGTIEGFPSDKEALFQPDGGVKKLILEKTFLVVDRITNSMQAQQFLDQAAATMQQRAKQYDKPDGERSMDATVKAFNAVTGLELTESHGWLFMLTLKNVRQWQKPDYHEDSAVDAVAYCALMGESLAKGK